MISRAYVEGWVENLMRGRDPPPNVSKWYDPKIYSSMMVEEIICANASEEALQAAVFGATLPSIAEVLKRLRGD
jgi:hypothetical protein